MRDAAWPSSVEPSTAAELVYAGGDTPNPEIWDTSTARYRVPCWVRSNPGNVSYISDAEMFLRWLDNNQVPPGVVTVLDLETAVDPYYVNGYGQLMHQAGYKVWTYGSTNYLFQNPALDGYFAADPTGVEHLYPGTVATQYATLGAYDLSVIAAGAALWDRTNPGGGPPMARQALPADALPVKDVTATWSPDHSQWDVVMLGANGHVYHIFWNVTAAAWEGPEDLVLAG